MSYESKKALERIVTLCEGSANLSSRQMRIYDIALEGLGYVASQRAEMVARWRDPHEARLRERIERGRAKMDGAAA